MSRVIFKLKLKESGLHFFLTDTYAIVSRYCFDWEAALSGRRLLLMRLPTVIVARHIANCKILNSLARHLQLFLILLCSIPQADFWQLGSTYCDQLSQIWNLRSRNLCWLLHFSPPRSTKRSKRGRDHVEISALETGSERPRAREASWRCLFGGSRSWKGEFNVRSAYSCWHEPLTHIKLVVPIISLEQSSQRPCSIAWFQWHL